jgi:hypothetical protein
VIAATVERPTADLSSPGLPCRRDPDAWFAGSDHTDRQVERAEARALCGGCEAQPACLDAALRFEVGKNRHYRYGVWGGMTPGERVREDQRRRRPAEQESTEEGTA